jgi:hypothetical protein
MARWHTLVAAGIAIHRARYGSVRRPLTALVLAATDAKSAERDAPGASASPATSS